MKIAFNPYGNFDNMKTKLNNSPTFGQVIPDPKCRKFVLQLYKNLDAGRYGALRKEVKRAIGDTDLKDTKNLDLVLTDSLKRIDVRDKEGNVVDTFASFDHRYKHQNPKTNKLVNKYTVNGNKVKIISSTTGDAYTLSFYDENEAKDFAYKAHFVSRARVFVEKLDRNWQRTKARILKANKKDS